MSVAAGVFTLAATALAASTNFVQPATSPEAVGALAIPVSVAAADLDGDGDQDLAVANVGPDNVTILRNNGVGNFVQPATSPEATGLTPNQVVAADFDGDGDQDLATANGSSNNVTILRNNGTGNFFQPASSPEAVGDTPQSLAAADFDGDGDQDLAVPNEDSNHVTILRNNGAGNFFQPAAGPEPAGASPQSVAAADLDGDGDPDLAIANEDSDDVTVLLHVGAGNFVQDRIPAAVGDAPHSVAAADLDGDGDQDLAFAHPNSDNVTVLKNNGSAAFGQPATSPEAAGDGPVSVAAADFDGDGDRDLAVANRNSDNATILANNGVGNFFQPATSPEPVGGDPFSVAAADLDGDGDPDLAIANTLTDNVTILRNL